MRSIGLYCSGYRDNDDDDDNNGYVEYLLNINCPILTYMLKKSLLIFNVRVKRKMMILLLSNTTWNNWFSLLKTSFTFPAIFLMWASYLYSTRCFKYGYTFYLTACCECIYLPQDTGVSLDYIWLLLYMNIVMSKM